MKIYTNTYDLAMPSANKFWVAPNSDFKIGIKVELRGQAYAGSFTLKQNGQTVTADDDKTAGFTTYTLKSGGPGSVIYTIDVPDAQQKFTLVQVVTDSTVFDVGGSGGGDVPADVATKSWVESQISDFADEDALTAYYTKTETSSAAEISTALEGKQPTGNYLTAETDPAFNNWLSGDSFKIGNLTQAGSRAIAIGYATAATRLYSVAIGAPDCRANADKAIQLGQGTNNESNTFNVFNYKMLSSDGKIPNERVHLSAVSESDWATLSGNADAGTFYFVY